MYRADPEFSVNRFYISFQRQNEVFCRLHKHLESQRIPDQRKWVLVPPESSAKL
jgi:hypothetical protein